MPAMNFWFVSVLLICPECRANAPHERVFVDLEGVRAELARTAGRSRAPRSGRGTSGPCARVRVAQLVAVREGEGERRYWRASCRSGRRPLETAGEHRIHHQQPLVIASRRAGTCRGGGWSRTRGRRASRGPAAPVRTSHGRPAFDARERDSRAAAARGSAESPRGLGSQARARPARIRAEDAQPQRDAVRRLESPRRRVASARCPCTSTRNTYVPSARRVGRDSMRVRLMPRFEKMPSTSTSEPGRSWCVVKASEVLSSPVAGPRPPRRGRRSGSRCPARPRCPRRRPSR